MGTREHSEGWWSGHRSAHGSASNRPRPPCPSPHRRLHEWPRICRTQGASRKLLPRRKGTVATSPRLPFSESEAAGEEQVTHRGANSRNGHRSRAQGSSLGAGTAGGGRERTGFPRPDAPLHRRAELRSAGLSPELPPRPGTGEGQAGSGGAGRGGRARRRSLRGAQSVRPTRRSSSPGPAATGAEGSGGRPGQREATLPSGPALLTRTGTTRTSLQPRCALQAALPG